MEENKVIKEIIDMSIKDWEIYSRDPGPKPHSYYQDKLAEKIAREYRITRIDPPKTTHQQYSHNERRAAETGGDGNQMESINKWMKIRLKAPFNG